MSYGDEAYAVAPYAGDGNHALPAANTTLQTATNTLGCGVWTVQIAERGGSPILLESPTSNVSCGRVVDEVRRATIVIPTADLSSHCLGLINKLRPWEHEVTLLRDGQDAWVGPIADNLTITRNGIVIVAKDLFSWFDKRGFTGTFAFGQTQDLSDTFFSFAQNGLARDPSPNISFDVQPSGISAVRFVLAGERGIVGDRLRELARDGVDFTMIGRTCRVRGPLGGDAIGPLLSSHFGEDLQVSYDGLVVGSEIVVVGAAPTGSNVPPVGIAGDVGARTGLVTQFVQESAIKTNEAAQSAADQLIGSLGVSPVIISGTLLANAPVRFEELVPGNFARLDLVLGGTYIPERAWLVNVDVTASPGNERIVTQFARGQEEPPDA